ncbi:MAG: hypothetical protein QG591_1974 [Planctomycetota bacterium]|nr:hypothetical protein [Planctomycetota bacterium]MDQ1284534.1 hypothetical protein [Patescibacteria group bacterium]
MMEAMGGRIGVDSKGAGFGSTFWVEAPREMGGEIEAPGVKIMEQKTGKAIRAAVAFLLILC